MESYDASSTPRPRMPLARVASGVMAAVVGAALAVAGAAGGAEYVVNTHRSSTTTGDTGSQTAGPGSTQTHADQSAGGDQQQGITAKAPVNGPHGTQFADDGSGAGPHNQGSGYLYAGVGAGSTTHQYSSSTKSQHTSRDQQVHGGTGTQNNGNGSQTINNPVKTDPPTAGVVSLEAVVPADGGTTMGGMSTFELDVKKLPNDGNTLFLVCRVPSTNPNNPNLFYAHRTIIVTGQQDLTVRWGGAYPNDPSLVGTTRVCDVVSANPDATEDLDRLMYADDNGIENDPDGVPYDAQRTSLPPGASEITGGLPVTIQRVDPQHSSAPTPTPTNNVNVQPS